MNKLIKGMTETSNVTTTAKGAKSNVSTLNACVDLFGSLGSMRARSDDQVVSTFTKAFAEDKLTALRILFYTRDVRGGLGERKVFRTIVKYLATAYTDVLVKNLNLFSEFGRWDDLFILEGTPAWDDVVNMILNQLEADVEAEKPSLLAKWMPSNNTSSKESRRLARYFSREMGWSDKQYRKTLSKLRKTIKIVETSMCANEWGDITYEHVPSRAAMIYRKAFVKHDESRYSQYLQDVQDGKKEIKASTLYPYDIVRNIIRSGGGCGSSYNNRTDFSFTQSDKTLNLQWDNLPNYVEPFNGLVIYDTSGSMGGSGYYGGSNNQVRPIDVALSLAIYIAERNTGIWQNLAIPFSSTAKLCKFTGNNIYEKLKTLDMTAFYRSTNLQAAFDLILDTAVKNDVSPDDMPKKLFIVSDMQFNSACGSNKRSNFEQIEKKYRKAGYDRPQIVFWNVNAYGKDTPITIDNNGTALVSGASPAVLKAVLAGDVITPVDVMMQAIGVERYDAVTV